MQSDGRMEKRVAVKIPVHLVSGEDSFLTETATTVNISRHGARVITSRRWQLGEELGITSLSGEFRRQGRVIYCCPLTDGQSGQFCVGLEFDASIMNWKDVPWTSVA